MLRTSVGTTTGSIISGTVDPAVASELAAAQKPRRVFNYPRLFHQLKFPHLIKSTKKFFKGLPHFLWTFFIDSLLIPAYRPEWSNYTTWQARPRVDPFKLNPKERRKDKLKTNKKRRKLMSVVVHAGVPRPVKHNHALCEILTINVSGRLFQTQLRTLLLFPNTLLGDSVRLAQFYDPVRQDYFIDRSRTCFEAILYFYQSRGILRRPATISLEIFEEEIRFYDLGAEVIEKLRREEGIMVELAKPLPKCLFQRKLWLLFEDPESSKQAKIVAVTSIMVVTISIFIFCLETVPGYADDGPRAEGATDSLQEVTDYLKLSDPFFFSETICIIWFVFEFLVRLLTAPRKMAFAKGMSNIIDLLAILPYFVTVFISKEKATHEEGVNTKLHQRATTLTLFRVVRLVRVFRILKLSRHNKGLKVLGKTLKASIRELGLLMFFLGIGIVLFSSAVYFADLSDSKSQFRSIIDAFWWSVITMTTCGYGDNVPVTIMGKLVGAVCAISGVLTLALPVPVIVSNFNNFYSREDEDESTRTNLASDHVHQCPFRSGIYITEVSVDEDHRTHHHHHHHHHHHLPTQVHSHYRADDSESEFETLRKIPVGNYKEARKVHTTPTREEFAEDGDSAKA